MLKSPVIAPHGCALPWRLAAPSCVYPSGVAENCTRLAPHFDEIGLAFFETGACLAYTGQDLPPELAALPVGWHMHLPLDLPWDAGAGRVAEVALALRERVRHLAPGAFVLHPPSEPGELSRLAGLLQAGGLDPRSLLVENIAGRDLERLWPAIRSAGLGVCLDLGHLLAHGQEDFLALPGLGARLGMIHLNAPHPRNPARHASLALLDDAGLRLMDRVLDLLPDGAVVMLELFDEESLFESLDLLRARTSRLMGGARPC